MNACGIFCPTKKKESDLQVHTSNNKLQYLQYLAYGIL